MTTELLTLIAAYFACAETAEQRHLSIDEVNACNAVYQQVKLSFVPGVDAGHFVQLSAKERNAVNRAGYLAFYTWRRDNPDTVRHLERVARGEVELGLDG